MQKTFSADFQKNFITNLTSSMVPQELGSVSATPLPHFSPVITKTLYQKKKKKTKKKNPDWQRGDLTEVAHAQTSQTTHTRARTHTQTLVSLSAVTRTLEE